MAVRLVVAVTDGDWFEHLSHIVGLEEVNFWAPSPANFRALAAGELFLFKLHAPRTVVHPPRRRPAQPTHALVGSSTGRYHDRSLDPGNVLDNQPHRDQRLNANVRRHNADSPTRISSNHP
jgi:hypothetical protein